MANDEHVALLKQGAEAWNAWRGRSRSIRPDLVGADLRKANLSEADLSEAELSHADLRAARLVRADLYRADLFKADLSGAELTRARLMRAKLGKATLSNANLSGADLTQADLSQAELSGANLSEARLFKADLRGAKLIRAYLPGAHFYVADLREADLRESYLFRANFSEANLGGANLSEAELEAATLVQTDLTGADLTACRVYGVSAWGLKLDRSKQQNLIITPGGEPEITVDNIEVAQFIYLMLHNQKLRDVIDTITSKVVLILGRFTNERKAVLNALREELRKRDYLPILFDFDKPRSLNTDETITLLARMARFVIADLSDAKSVLQELRAIVPDLPSLPVQPIILGTQEEPGMFDFYRNRSSFLAAHRYADQQQLIADLGDKVIRPAELKVRELRG